MSIQSYYPTIRPSYIINFSKKTLLNSGVRFTRGGGGTYVDENGLIVSAIPDQPRFNHNPETLEYEGLLVEEVRTNPYRYSDTWGLGYANNDGGVFGVVDVTTNYGIAPDGTQTSVGFTLPTSTIRTWSATIPNPSGANCFSFFAKPIGNQSTITLSHHTGINFSITYNFDTLTSSGSVTTNVSSYSHGILKYPNGWYRVYLVFVAPTLSFWPSLVNQQSVEVWGKQLESGSFPTSYIPTASSAITRPADLISVSSVSNVKSGRIKFSSATSNSYSPYFTLKDSTSPAKPYVLELGSVNSAPVASVVYNLVRQGTTSIPSVPGTGVPSESTLSFNFEPTTGAVEISSTASDDADSHVLSLPANLSRPLPSDQTLNLLSVESKSVPLSLKEIYLWETALTIDQLASVSSELRSIGQPVEASTGLNENSDYVDAEARPTLDLRFAERKDLFDDTTEQNLVTFSRGSIGTYTDENGIIQTAVADEPRFDHDPTTGESLGLLVEEPRTNSQPYSSKYDTSSWGFSYGIKQTPNATVAPDGTLTATLIQQDTSDSIHQLAGGLGFNNGYITLTSTYTLSLYVKYYNSNKIRFMEQNTYGTPTNGSYTKAGVIFNFETESIEKTIQWNSSAQSLIAGYKVDKLPDGWYRLSLSVIPGTDLNNQRVYFGVYPQEGNLSGAVPIPSGAVGIDGANYYSGTNVTNFVGDGSTGVYIWGAQVELGSFPTSYIPTPPIFTSRASIATYYDATGTIQIAAVNEARDNAYLPDSNGVFHPAGLLLEAASTNSFTYSNDLTQSVYSKNNIILSVNSAIAPDGTNTATKVIPTTDSVVHSISRLGTLGLSSMRSVYVKAAEYTSCTVYDINTGAKATIDLITGNITNASYFNFDVYSQARGRIRNVGNGWWRIEVGYDTYSAVNNPFHIYPNNNSTFAGDGTSGILVWGYQQEANVYPQPTSYIPTTTATVTRAADVSSSATVTRSADVAQITGSNFSSWYNQSEGSFSLIAPTLKRTAANQPVVLTTSSSPIEGVQFWNSSGVATRYRVYKAGSLEVDISISTYEGANWGWVYKVNDVALFKNGALLASDTSCAMPTAATLLSIGSDGIKHISRLTYWPTRLPDTTLQVLTDPAISTWDLVFDSSLSTDGTCAIITASTCTYTIDWGDGTPVETINATGTGFEATHRYTFPQTYKAKIEVLSGAFRPYYNNSVYADQLLEIRQTPDGWTNTSTSGFGTNLQNAWYGANNLTVVDRELNTSGVTNFIAAWQNCTNLTSFPLLDTSSGTNFSAAWYNCTSLTSFPLLDTSICTNFYATWFNCTSLTSFPLLDTSSGTNFSFAWSNCASLTSFPLLDTSICTNFSYAWQNCTSLTSFPLLDTSSGINFSAAWYNCTSLTSFPLLDTSSGTTFNQAWRICTSLTSFPANFFDSWTGTPVNNCFVNAWGSCTSLTATSVENILNSIDTSGRSAPASGVDITITYNASSGTPNVLTAVTNLKSRGWTITLNGVLQ